MKLIVLFLAAALCGAAMLPEFPLKKIIGKGLLKTDEWQFTSDSANSPTKRCYHFYTNVSPDDSVTVIGEQLSDEFEEYAFIIHNLNSDSHDTFSDGNIREWRDRSIGEVSMRDAVDQVRDIDPVLLEKLKGFWVYVYKYKGEFYLHQDWATLIAREMTDSTWVQIDMEVTAQGITTLQGNEECFRLGYGGCEKTFRRIDARREIYQDRKDSYMIPVRRIHDFKLIAYCNNTGDCISSFVKWDKD